MSQLINLARADAAFEGVPMYDTSTVTVDIPSIKVDKQANMPVWHGDELTYTVMITNLDTAIAATDVSFKDTIDPALAALILDSVSVNGDPLVIGVDFTYDETTGELEISSMEDIAPKGQSKVTFRVKKA